MDQSAYESLTLHIQQHDNNHMTKTSIDKYNFNTTPNNQASSSQRRQLEESNSPGKSSQRQTKKQRQQNSSTTPSSTRYFGFPIQHLKHAVANRPPCYFIRFNSSNKGGQFQNFPFFVPAGYNRYKFGVATREDFLKLWNCNWPNKMNQIEVKVERPRAVPDSSALVIRHIPLNLDNGFIY
ncbi:unnamed protein product [Adineta ricciae]|uniref:Uncharacterized protein n=1 Tax=Adineta ricciae TaxID=249248 RepID=A0A816CY07_ADIRI|nr:unnamed protein product [Adineta ricciae]CAF1630058.1 unnamed protein product [Adineta ricciae]